MKLIALALLNLCLASQISQGDETPFQLRLQSRERAGSGTNDFKLRTNTVEWLPSRTAVVICDMWDKHHCEDASARVAQMVPRMNALLRKARSQGALIVHCPSETLEFYKDHPGRKLAQTAPPVKTSRPIEGWCARIADREPPLPVDDSDSGCDGCPDCPEYRAWTRQHPGLDILPGDAITDSAEALYLMRSRGITNVLVMGVHVNRCVLGRPFGIRQLVLQGQNVALMRDLTDAMYNHRKAPWVSHFRGNELVIEHIEKYWCPTVTSVDLIGGEPFRFKADKRKTIGLITGENEYNTEETLRAFAQRELAWRGFNIIHVAASTNAGATDFLNFQTLTNADVLVVSVRRRALPSAMMSLLRGHLQAGKSLVGLRTASHAFDTTAPDDSLQTWPVFDREVLGARYENHYGNKPPGPRTLVNFANMIPAHPTLFGLAGKSIQSSAHLYKFSEMADSCDVLATGHVDGQDQTQPVAWINRGHDRRAFYTSLGNEDDFASPAFRRLLLNGILWTLDEPVPPEEAGLAAGH